MIFISYRRDDESYFVRHLYDVLVAEFGKDAVMMDIDSIPLGVDFSDYITQQIRRASVTIAVIGPQWESLPHRGKRRGPPRIMNPADFVRREVEESVRSRVPIIPVFVSRDADLTPESLPESLHFMCRLNGLVVKKSASVQAAFHKLRERLERVLAEGARRSVQADGASDGVWKPMDQLANADFSGIAINGVPFGWQAVASGADDLAAAIQLKSAGIAGRVLQICLQASQDCCLQQVVHWPGEVGRLKFELDIQFVTSGEAELFASSAAQHIRSPVAAVSGQQSTVSLIIKRDLDEPVLLGLRMRGPVQVRLRAFRLWGNDARAVS